jgi:hypothetical protein
VIAKVSIARLMIAGTCSATSAKRPLAAQAADMGVMPNAPVFGASPDDEATEAAEEEALGA